MVGGSVFRVLEPDRFGLQKSQREKQPLHQKFLEEVQAEIRSRLVETAFPQRLEARVKGFVRCIAAERQQRGLEQVTIACSARDHGLPKEIAMPRWCRASHLRPVPGRSKITSAMPEAQSVSVAAYHVTTQASR